MLGSLVFALRNQKYRKHWSDVKNLMYFYKVLNEKLNFHVKGLRAVPNHQFLINSLEYALNPFVLKGTFFLPPKNIWKPFFQGIEEGCIGNKSVNYL